MIVPPPALFSTTIGWPRIFSSRSPSTRAPVSVTPPGAYGTTMRIGRSGQACARPGRGTNARDDAANRERRFIFPPDALRNRATACEARPRKSGVGVRDAQGLEVANADAGAIEALDFLREEWLVFGKRLDRFVKTADKEERCALLPVLAANLVLSMNSADGRALGERYMTRARAMAKGIGPREQAWIAATDAWLAGEGNKSLAIHEKIVAEWPRDLLAGKLGQLHAFN